MSELQYPEVENEQGPAFTCISLLAKVGNAAVERI